MKDLISNFPTHLTEGLSIAQAASLKPAERPFDHVVISGLGGSGIGGTIVSELVANKSKYPITTNKGYHLPGFVGERSLVIVCSYSGNTEETLSAYEQAKSSGAQIAFITSGGRALEEARTNGLNYIIIPGGNPPRSMLGYSFVQLFRLLENYGVIDDDYRSEITAFVNNLDRESLIKSANAAAKKLSGTIPIIYSCDGSQGVAVRFRQQLNENSKMLCWHAVIPEMNHNELVGWSGGDERFSVVIFRNETDYIRNQKRTEINVDIISAYTNNIQEVWSKGSSAVERALYLIHWGDWVSYELSVLNEVDVVAIDAIDRLKGELADFKAK